MKKIGIIIFIATLFVGVAVANMFSFGQTSARFFNISINRGVKGSGNIVSEARDARGFKAIEVGGAIEVEVVAQKDFSVEVQADDNLLQFVKTEVRGDTLEIRTEKRFSTRNTIRVKIGAPDIDNLEVSGASRLSLANLKNEALRIDASGASKINVDGETKNLIVELSGASRLDADDLKSENVDVDASGASHAAVFVSSDLKADLSGASRVTYAGNPKNFSNKTSGASSISAR